MQDKLRDDQLRVLWISRFDYSSNSGVKPHLHSDLNQLLIVIDGEGEIQLNDQVYPVLPGQGYLLPKGLTHSFLFSKASSVIDFKFHISSDQLSQLILNKPLSEPFSVAHTLNDFKKLFHLSSLFLKHTDDLLPYRIDVGFKSTLISLVHEQLQKTAPPKTHLILDQDLPDFPIVQYLREHLQSKITLEDVAKSFGYHPHYLVELSKKHLGISPMHYLQHLRLEKAKEYLEFSRLYIKEIAELIGLSPFYLSRLFTEREGISLTQYREQTRTVIGKDITLEKDFPLETQPVRWKD